MYQIKYEEIAILSKEEKKNKKIDDLCKLKHFSIALDCINRKPDYYITNYQKFIDADKAIDIAKEYKFYDKSNPRKIYKKSFKEDDDTLPEKWETLFELKCDTEKILNACRIERDNFLNVDEALKNINFMINQIQERFIKIHSKKKIILYLKNGKLYLNSNGTLRKY